MKAIIKNFLKDRFLIFKIRDRLSPAVHIAQRNMYLTHKNLISTGNPARLSETGYRVFSQFEEDGKLLFIFAVIGMGNKTFVEIGADDGINSNAANLYFNFGWRGLFIDGNCTSIARGKRFYDRYPHPWFFKPAFTCSKVNRENVNELIRAQGIEGEVGLLSIDIDGNDYWIWDAITTISPRVVIIETHVEFGLRNIVVPYDPKYSYPGKHPVYHGASPTAMTNLARRKGYRLVGANELGFNFIFVRNGLGEEYLPEVSVESVLQHPSVKDGYRKFEAIKDWQYVEG